MADRVENGRAAVEPNASERTSSHLGTFLVNLAVRDVELSKDFYEKLGFQQVLGDTDLGWAVMRNGSASIGLFQDMFDRNILSFSQGWDQHGNRVNSFDDIRAIHTRLKAAGLWADLLEIRGEGPASLRITDPDGNCILIDHHA